jgi:hypothetical protein
MPDHRRERQMSETVDPVEDGNDELRRALGELFDWSIAHIGKGSTDLPTFADGQRIFAEVAETLGRQAVPEPRVDAYPRMTRKQRRHHRRTSIPKPGAMHEQFIQVLMRSDGAESKWYPATAVLTLDEIEPIIERIASINNRKSVTVTRREKGRPVAWTLHPDPAAIIPQRPIHLRAQIVPAQASLLDLLYHHHRTPCEALR